MKPPRITHLLVLLVTACALLAHCTSAQKDKAKVMAEQILTNVGKDAGIAVANVATDLAQLKLAQAKQKLAAQRAAVTETTSLKDLAALSTKEIAAKEADKLLAAAQAQLSKLKEVDALPPVAPSDAKAPAFVLVTPTP